MNCPCGGCDRKDCRFCWLRATDARYRLLWGGDATGMLMKPERKRRAKRPACIHLGEVLPRESGQCSQRLRRCDEFGVCTLRPCDKSEHSCTLADGQSCPRYQADE